MRLDLQVRRELRAILRERQGNSISNIELKELLEQRLKRKLSNNERRSIGTYLNRKYGVEKREIHWLKEKNSYLEIIYYRI